MKRLFAASGNKCAFPNCRTELVKDGTILGEICHIKSAKPNGPRFDQFQSAEDRHGYDNLILLCSIHHTVIDDDEKAYTVERLARMKLDHGTSVSPVPDDSASDVAELIFTTGQIGGITSRTINANVINVHPPSLTPDSTTTSAQAADSDLVLAFFAPELARILAQQVHIFDRAIVNFVSASVGHPQPTDHWTTFRPWKPTLYPATASFRDLASEDAALLVEFYDSLNEIDDLIKGWRDSETVWDVNVWNYLMQKVQHSVSLGVQAAKRFCPSRQYNATMPATGTLIDQATRSVASMRSALTAHIDRFNARASANSPSTNRNRR